MGSNRIGSVKDSCVKSICACTWSRRYLVLCESRAVDR